MSDSVHRRTVFIVDDDAAMRDSLGLMLGLLGHTSVSYDCAEAFLDAWSPGFTGCIVSDMKLPGMSGLELQAALRSRGCGLPFIIITAHGDVSSARAAFLNDAVDFLEKPFTESALQSAVENAMHIEQRRSSDAHTRAMLACKLERLTPRERELLTFASRGLHTKQIADAMGISARTVEVHKSRLMAKLEARNVSDLVRIAVAMHLD